MTEQIQNRPAVSVGAYIYNEEGKIFLMRSPKWKNKLIAPGGKIEFMESSVAALKREVKEETNLEIDSIEFLTPVDCLDLKDYGGSLRHFVGLNFKARALNEKEVKLDGEEGEEYLWLTPEEAIKRDDVQTIVTDTIKNYFIKSKKGLFGKACKDCEKHKAESEEYKAGWQRALADYKNLQNEINTRRGEWAQMSETQILEEFIPVYENFKKAFYHHPEVNPDNEEHKTFKNWIDGIGFIMKQFESVLKAHGVEEVKTVGEKFDPNFHEAISALAPESDDSVQGKNQESGMVVKELEGGYKVGDKVIKAAKVIINK